MLQESIEFLSAVLIYSREPERLASFYRDVLGLPLEEEQHGGPVHYGCELGDIHFAIHPSEEDLSSHSVDRRIKIAFVVFSTQSLLFRLKAHGVEPIYPPKQTAFATFTAIEDPDGNYLEFTELSEGWFKHLRSRKQDGYDVVARWKGQSGKEGG
jgi:catechol 2,3-dioxygenase-like lactoylglutathione lyase family enzyme